MESFNVVSFEQKIEEGLRVVRQVLGNARNPKSASSVEHRYDDKYLLAEYVTNSALASLTGVLFEHMATGEAAGGALEQLRAWANQRAVTLRLAATETCTFDRKTEEKVEGKTEHVKEHSFGVKVTDKVVRTVRKWFWKVNVRYELLAYAGNDPAERVVLRSKVGESEVMTTSENAPHPAVRECDPLEVNITWLLQRLSPELAPTFSIDRSAKSCHTPRRNADTEAAMAFVSAVRGFAEHVRNYFGHHVFPIERSDSLMGSSDVFVPATPLLEERSGADGKPASPVLGVEDLNALLAEHANAIRRKLDTFSESGAPGKLIAPADLQLVFLMEHVQSIAAVYHCGVSYIEEMLRKQLIAAVGKVVTPADFADYMSFHNRKLYRSAFEPQLFCHAVRRPDHYPEGVVSLEQRKTDGSVAEPLRCAVSHAEAGPHPMRFPLSAASEVRVLAERFVHGWIGHQFSGETGSSVSLCVRARQFSSFILLLGRMGGPGLFEPSHAMIVKNKDDVNIPIDLEQIPTPKEFADAIESLSPEQQRFAKAIRSMQLEGTVFGLMVVHIKPQLERLLNLHADGLTKEIRLTSDLLDLFMQYQIPSDLLSFSGDAATPGDARVEAVREHVRAMNEMIQAKKDEELAFERKRKEMAEAELRRQAELQRLETERVMHRDRKRKKMAMPSRRMASSSKSMAVGCAAPKPQLSRAQAPSKPPAPKKAPAPTPSPTPTPAPAATTAVSVPEPVAEAPVEAKEPSLEASGMDGEGEDYTQLPVKLDAMLGELDEDAAVRPTIINVGKQWQHQSQRSLLAEPETRTMEVAHQKEERKKAFDLLDALTRSGALEVRDAALHVVIAATHCFDKTLLETVVQDNVNPIEKVERSSLIVSSVVHGVPAAEMVKQSQLERVKTYSPNLF